MKKNIIKLILFIFIVPTSVFSNDLTNSLNKIDALIKNGKIIDGKLMLENISSKKDLSISERAIINNKLSWFFDEVVGDYDKSLQFSQYILESDLSDSDEIKIEANSRIKKINRLKSKFFKEDNTLRKLSIGARNETEAEKNIEKLKQLIEKRPGYYRKMEVYHYIGIHNLYLKNYYRSNKIFSKILSAKPGIIFLLPTESSQQTAKKNLIHYFIYNIPRFIIIISLITLIGLLYLSKFWEWVNYKFFFSLPLVIITWSIFLIVISWGLNLFIPDEKNLSLPAPYFIQSNPLAPGSGLLLIIFFYGILGIIFSSLFTLAVQYFKNFKIRVVINFTIIILFVSSIFSVFFINHCYEKSFFQERNNNPFPLVTGHMYFQERDFEPYILINPRNYPDLNMENSDDKLFIDWVHKQYSIITGESVENTK